MTEQFFVVESPAELCAVIEQRHPLVKQAYDELGTAKVQALKYHVGNIRRELVKGLSIGDDYKIVKMINDAFQKQTADSQEQGQRTLAGDLRHAGSATKSQSDRPCAMIRDKGCADTNRG